MFRHQTLCLAAIAFFSTLFTAAAQQKILHSFSPTELKGIGPEGGVILDAAGNLYGTTNMGGNLETCSDYGCGTIFELSPQADGTWTETVLHKFTGPDGGFPESPLIFDAAGNLYGVTWTGGNWGENACFEWGCGTVFELSPGAGGKWTEKVLYNFCPKGGHCLDGFRPGGALTFDAAGNIYGTVEEGGAHFHGGVFKLSPKSDGAWKETLLYSFEPNEEAGYPTSGVILDSAGNVYGEASAGGSGCTQYGGCGAIFELSLDHRGKWLEKILYDFNTSNGANGNGPGGGLIFDAAGNLYGTTPVGGAHGNGNVFELSPSTDGTWTLSTLHSFYDFRSAEGVIFDPSGNLYGASSIGGPRCPILYNQGCGTIYKLVPTPAGAWTYTELFVFDGAKNGAGASAVVMDGSGNLYGTTTWGGAYLGNRGAGYGTVFEFTP
jgi:uncharacterized repeat protein (TIGR03803 family)